MSEGWEVWEVWEVWEGWGDGEQVQDLRRTTISSMGDSRLRSIPQEIAPTNGV
ncbi:MAG: hypothetical protein F6K40_31320 [Okeania sp. SIO3I5]|uniref:hypothetical protein n=1 Tax=Okeania sp. SIO3I5 TaxID=2607805 RepID=UPI0013BDAC7B|nr:hypothetical protein [Okeania sp. SIO3I5]NEQ40480.1 hypothetical protein [Okeania sp. SIO3I5]